MLTEAATHLELHCGDYCEQMGLRSPQVRRKFVLEAALVWNGWTLVPKSTWPMILKIVPPLEVVLGTTFWGRVSDALWQRLRPSRRRDLATAVANRWQAAAEEEEGRALEAETAAAPARRSSPYPVDPSLSASGGIPPPPPAPPSLLWRSRRDPEPGGAVAPARLPAVLLAEGSGDTPAELLPEPAPTPPAGAAASVVAGEFSVADLAANAARLRRPPAADARWPPDTATTDEGVRWHGLRGRFLWNTASDKPAPHIRRIAGTLPVMALNPGSVPDLCRWAAAGAPMGSPSASPELALRTVVDWLGSRPAIRDRVSRVTVATPPGIAWQSGWWLRLQLVGQTAEVEWPVPEGYRRSFHGTALACLARIMARGPATGWAVNSDRGAYVRGVFSLAPERAHLLLSYILYTALDRSGYLIGPVLELCSPCVDGAGRKTVLKRRRGASNCDQWLSYEDTTQVVACWLNVVHVAEFAAAEGSSAFYAFAEGALLPELELHPDASWSDLEQASRAAHEERP